MAKVVTITLFAALFFASGCATPWTPPTAAEILAKVSKSDMKDGHLNVKTNVTSGAFSADLSGDGTMVLKPKYALSLRLQGSLGQIPIALEQIETDGKSYSRVGIEKWSEMDSKGEPGGGVSKAKNPKIIGEDSLSVGKSWHVQATDASSGRLVDIWVLESDGYLAKYSGNTDNGSIALTFDKYNTGATVAAPPASEVKPPAKNVTGRVGAPISLNAVTVSVVTADLNAKGGNEFVTPKPGNRFVTVQVLYEDSGTDAYNYNGFDWKLKDASGFSYTSTYADIGPELNSGSIRPREMARGFITYEVPVTATGLVLTLTSGGDSATVPLG